MRKKQHTGDFQPKDDDFQRKKEESNKKDSSVLVFIIEGVGLVDLVS